MMLIYRKRSERRKDMSKSGVRKMSKTGHDGRDRRCSSLSVYCNGFGIL